YFTKLSNAPSTIPDGSPLESNYVVSGYGMRLHPILKVWKIHYGIDLDCNGGEPIYAPADGVVLYAQTRGGCGNAIQIEHPSGYKTRYCHLKSYNTQAGSSVSRGDVIGYCGTTGMSTGYHLHYEIKKNGALVNPIRWISGGQIG
ncbi:MAG: M23 family metallopeptidase, partial [Alphaproteobacteria bacterium]|nr:M23 family metallopeptidase [Alphaproteobacteria bacterium]